MVKTYYLIVGLLAVVLGFAVPDVTLSDWRLDDCIEDCRSTFDPVKDMGAYTDCVQNCKRRYPDHPPEEP